MTSLNNTPGEPIGMLDDADRQLRDDLESVYRLPVPVMQFDAAAVPARPTPMVGQHRWRPAFVAAAAVAGLALFAGGTSLFGGSPSEVSAQEVFEKTHAIAAMNSAAAGDFSYHMVATNETFLPPGAGPQAAVAHDTTTETWYQDAEHQRTETRNENGELVFGQSRSGDDLWFYSTAPGSDELRVVHSDVESLGYGALAAHDFGVNSLAGLLELYSGKCAEAESVGEEVVAGRPAYVIEVTQTPETCDLKPVITTDGDITTVKVEAPAGAAGVGVAMGSVNVASAGAPKATAAEGARPDVEFRIIETTTRMWVDQETFISLKTETDSEDGLLFRYEVTEFEADPQFDPSTFDYEPPAGVEVVEADGPEDIKSVLSGGGAYTEAVPAFDSGEVETEER